MVPWTLLVLALASPVLAQPDDDPDALGDGGRRSLEQRLRRIDREVARDADDAGDDDPDAVSEPDADADAAEHAAHPHDPEARADDDPDPDAVDAEGEQLERGAGELPREMDGDAGEAARRRGPRGGTPAVRGATRLPGRPGTRPSPAPTGTLPPDYDDDAR